MEYFAKSKRRPLTLTEKKYLKEKIENLILELQNKLEDWEEKALKNAEERIMKDDGEVQKTLTAHLQEAVKCAEHFFDQYGNYFTKKEKTLILEACRNHDIGKVNLVFQMIVNPELKQQWTNFREHQIPHGYLSAVSISGKEFLAEHQEMTKEDFNIMVTAVYYHHARADEYDDQQIREYSEKYYEAAVKDYLKNSQWKITCMNRSNLLFENKNASQNRPLTDQVWEKYLIVKGMLNKFDWTVSAGYAEAEQNPDLLKKQLKKNIEEALSDNLRPVQQYMREHINDNLIIIAPTGSGKTEAALLWLNGEKGFYTLPLKVSSNAIYDRIIDQYEYKDAAILHSDSMTKYLEEVSTEDKEDGFEKYEKARLLSAPLTVCTVDQLFTFVFRALGTEIFAATLKYSKLVLDEIQAYSPRVVAALIYGLKIVSEMGGRFAIITATFPPVLKLFMDYYGLSSGEQYQIKDFSKDADLQRHMLSLRKSEMDVEEIINAGRDKKVLVICNTIARAQEIYQKIVDNSGEDLESVRLLHAHFIRQDRNALENKIMEFSREENTTGIWVTTQIVEASLDIDFDILYTEMCSCDSLLQRMGRCNRAGRYLPVEPNIIVFDNENGVKYIYDKDIYRRSSQYLEEYISIVFTENMKTEYINNVYDPIAIKETAYYQEINDFLEHFDALLPIEYSKSDANNEFRLINSITVMPDTVYEENREIIEACKNALHEPHIGAEVKAILNTKISSLTMSMNTYYGKYPLGVDKMHINDTNIHRANLTYEFDPGKISGRGLILGKKEGEDMYIFG